MAKERTILEEQFIQEAVVNYLAGEGWNKYLKSNGLHEKGVDIKVGNNKYSRYWLIEVKGDPSKNVKYPSGSRSSNLNSAVGQIISRMHTNRKTTVKYGGNYYGIAFSEYYRDSVIKKIPYYVMNMLHLYVFIVNDEGETEKINWQDMKKIQNSK